MKKSIIILIIAILTLYGCNNSKKEKKIVENSTTPNEVVRVPKVNEKGFLLMKQIVLYVIWKNQILQNENK